MKRLNISKEEINRMIELYNSGLSGIQISNIIGYSHQTICRRLNDNGIKMKNGGYYSTGQFKKGNIPWKKGQDNRINIICINCKKEFKVFPYRKDTVKVCSYKCRYETQKGKKLSEETIKKLSIYHKLYPVKVWLGRKMPKETREKMSKNNAKYWLGKKRNSDTIEKLRNAAIKRCKNKDYLEKMSKIMKNKWKIKEYREKVIKSILIGSLKRPTSLEKQMIEIINKYKLPYKYVGNGSFLIGYKNPDFININGEKKLIEVGNVFHHQGDYKEKREEHFKKYGWKSYFFIGQKLDEITVINKLKEVKFG